MHRSRRHRFRRAMVLAVSLALLARTVSAQLLQNPLSPSTSVLQPLAGLVVDPACTASVLASSPKLDAAVQEWVRTESSGSSDTLRVIVSAGPGLLAPVETLVLQLGGSLLGDLPGINALVANVTESTLSLLACVPGVLSVSIDAIVAPTGDLPPVPTYSLRATLGLPQDVPAGSGVGVAVVDSGIATSADFGNRIASFFDFTNGVAPVPAAPTDQYGHGTHVAGLIASTAGLSGGAYQGLGPQVKLVGLKVLDGTGSGRTSDVIRAIQFATLLRSTLGVQVINLSLGHPIYEPAARDPLVRAVEAASRAGIVVVAAAGNYGTNRQTGEIGYGGITSPGNAPSAITVGAVMTQNTITRRDDRVAPYSSRGPSWYDGFAKPDIVAPGHGLVSDAAIGSSLYVEYPSFRVGASYFRLSGTSMATAVASGAVALVLEANQNAHPGAPPLAPNAVKAILEYSSTRIHDQTGDEYDDLTQGAGELNAAGALDLARAIDTRQPVGWYWWTTAVSPLTTVAGEAWTWAQHLLWRTQTIWGPSVDTNQTAWLLSTAWGADNTWDSHIVWGTDAVWGSNSSTWSSHIVWGTTMVGSSTDGQHIVWGTATAENTTTWGNLADAGTSSPGQ
ncbi:MAG TPA: S8 family peptidase [Vicinamibacterales bacterium]|nr:S8 family peptidase [Vicinamibacterales bacterium]